MQVPYEAPKRKYCESHRRTRKRGIKTKPTHNQGKEQSETQLSQSPPALESKNEYLYYVGTKDAIKEEVRWRYGLQLVEQAMRVSNNQSNEKKKVRPKKKVAMTQLKSDVPKPTKLEQKLQFKEYMK